MPQGYRYKYNCAIVETRMHVVATMSTYSELHFYTCNLRIKIDSGFIQRSNGAASLISTFLHSQATTGRAPVSRGKDIDVTVLDSDTCGLRLLMSHLRTHMRRLVESVHMIGVFVMFKFGNICLEGCRPENPPVRKLPAPLCSIHLFLLQKKSSRSRIGILGIYFPPDMASAMRAASCANLVLLRMMWPHL